MKNIKVILAIFCGLLWFSCSDDDNPEPQPTVDYSDIDVITGMDFFDQNGQAIGRWGFPNHNPSDVFVYPIPNIGIVSVNSQDKLKRIWLVPVNCFKDSVTMDITMLSESVTYETSEIEAVQIKDIPTPDFVDVVQLDFSDVNIGFYKIFYQKENDAIHWRNIYIDPTVNNISDFSFMENNCL